MRRGLAAIALASSLGIAACPGAKAPTTAPPAASSKSFGKLEVPLAEVTNQFVLDKAWDGRFEDCERYGEVALSIVADDLETMELYLRCANARGTLWKAEQFVTSAYAPRIKSAVARYALGLIALLRGDPPRARKIFEALGAEAPAAYYQAAVAAEIDDDALGAEKLVDQYVKVRPSDPAGRALQAEIVCATDLARCQTIMETTRSTDDDETATARRLGAAVSTPVALARASLDRLAADASTLHATAFEDMLGVLSKAREGGDPDVFVRAPRTGRPEPGPNPVAKDLARDAYPMARLPFFSRVVQAIVRNDPGLAAAYAQLSALFPNDLATYRLARRSEKAMAIVRKGLESSAQTLWRVVAASEVARTDEMCALSVGIPWTDRGPAATMIRARCEIATDAARGRKIADARLHAPPFGVGDVATAIEGELREKDGVALKALAQSIGKTAPSSMLMADALWAAGEADPKKGKKLFDEALVQSGFDPVFARKLLRRDVEAHDVDHAKMTIAQALTEAPHDAFLCGVEGEILLNQNKPLDALQWLTKSCVSARMRREQDILGDTLATLPTAMMRAQKSKDSKKSIDEANKCLKGE